MWARICRLFPPVCRLIYTPPYWLGYIARPKFTAMLKPFFTNTVPVDAYRGAGRPEATYVLERIVEKAARQAQYRSGGIAPQKLYSPRCFPLSNAGGIAI